MVARLLGFESAEQRCLSARPARFARLWSERPGSVGRCFLCSGQLGLHELRLRLAAWILELLSARVYLGAGQLLLDAVRIHLLQRLLGLSVVESGLVVCSVLLPSA